MGKVDIETTLAITGSNAENFLSANGADPRRFVFPAYEGDTVITSPFGKIGISYEERKVNGDPVKVVVFDCSEAPPLRGSLKKPKREISVNTDGIGIQQFRNVELFVVTKHFNR